MKKKLLYFFLICFLTSCLEEQNNPLLVASCTDKIKNQNEEGIDCGGICGVCEKEPEPATVPCKSTLVNNRLTINGIDKNLSSSDFICTQEADLFEIYIMKDNQEIVIEIYTSSLPTKTTAIPLVPYYNAKEGDASIRLFNFYVFNSQTGTLYVSKVNNVTTVEFCSVALTSQGVGYTISGRIICN
jgi:hypothetical protein